MISFIKIYMFEYKIIIQIMKIIFNNEIDGSILKIATLIHYIYIF
jgi:hypothetical protein